MKTTVPIFLLRDHNNLHVGAANLMVVGGRGISLSSASSCGEDVLLVFADPRVQAVIIDIAEDGADPQARRDGSVRVVVHELPLRRDVLHLRGEVELQACPRHPSPPPLAATSHGKACWPPLLTTGRGFILHVRDKRKGGRNAGRVMFWYDFSATPTGDLLVSGCLLAKHGGDLG